MNQAQENHKSAAAACRRRLVALVWSFPGARTVPVGDGHLSLEVRNRRFGWFLDNPHGDGRLALNLKAPSGANQRLAAWDAARFHVPKYLGRHGWVGVWLDRPPPDWEEIEELIGGAYWLTAPTELENVSRTNNNTTQP